jgi:hypothetical protein
MAIRGDTGNAGPIVYGMSVTSSPGELSPNWRYRPKSVSQLINIGVIKQSFVTCGKLMQPWTSQAVTLGVHDYGSIYRSC